MSIAFRRATAADLPAIVSLLAEDMLGRSRETAGGTLDPRYEAAFQAVDSDPRQMLVVADLDGAVVGTMQITLLPGIGRMLVDDVGARDLPKVQGELLALTGFVLIVGFFVDLLHRILDPRQREAS